MICMLKELHPVPVSQTMQFHLTPFECFSLHEKRGNGAIRCDCDNFENKSNTDYKLYKHLILEKNWLSKKNLVGSQKNKKLTFRSLFFGGHTCGGWYLPLTKKSSLQLLSGTAVASKALRDPRCLRFNRSFGLPDIGMSGTGFPSWVGGRWAPCKSS